MYINSFPSFYFYFSDYFIQYTSEKKIQVYYKVLIMYLFTYFLSDEE